MDIEVRHMLTTVDNPYDPVQQYEQWYMWDMEAGYNTPSTLARHAPTVPSLSDQDEATTIERAIDEIIANDDRNLYRRVTI